MVPTLGCAGVHQGVIFADQCRRKIDPPRLKWFALIKPPREEPECYRGPL
jgi:hypothetical protein